MNTSEQSEPGAAKKNQTGLWLLAIVLLAIMVWLNIRQFRPNQVAEPVPFPSNATASTPMAAPTSAGNGVPGFTRLAPELTGVEMSHPIVEGHPREYLYYSGMAAGGVAVGDVNNDGRPDLFVTSGPESNRLFLQSATAFVFEDATETAGLETKDLWSNGATMVDINADGWLDIYVANYDAPNQLFVNRGDGTFVEEAYKYGLNMTDASLEGVFADVDRDGDLDMYLLTYRFENPDGMPLDPPLVVRNGKKIVREEFQKFYDIADDDIGYGVIGRSDGMLINNGDGTFTAQSEEAGLVGRGHGHSAMWWDFDDDGFQDLFVGNDFNDPDRLYRGGGKFTDVSREMIPHTTWFSMGCDTGDVDNDGRLDLLTTDMSSTTHFKQKTTMGSMGRNVELLTTAVPRQYMRNALLLGGPGRFREAAYLTNLDSTDWTWSAQLIDLDCDGRLDAFFTNGSVRSFTDSDRVLTLSQRKGRTEWDIYKDTPPLNEENLAFRNLGELKFEDVSKSWRLNDLGVSMSSAHGDFDGDGDLDLVVVNVDEPLAIYRNDLSANNRIVLDLRARGQNRFGTGARVSLSTESGKQLKELQPSRGFIASNEPALFFGCGNATQADIHIRWPDGTTESRLGLATGMRHVIAQSEKLPKPTLSQQRPTRGLYRTQPLASKDAAHKESSFSDYDIQPLLPHQMSRLGPGMAAADFDADGKLEYYRGGAKGQAARMFGESVASDSGQFSQVLDDSVDHEDMGALWLDVDNDGDLDLLVASGSNETGRDSAAYPLRLYLNDGNQLVHDINGDHLESVETSAGALAAADYDQDGDTDVFVCGRQSPEQYPLPGKSFLLINDAGRLVDQTESKAPGVNELGMATGALWSDVDNDNDLDLLVTGEWDHIRLFKNEGGSLKDESVASGLNRYRGWWTGISAGDFDNDGDLDYVATNLGLNTKYHANDDHPFRIYYGDFDGSGERKLVEAEYEKETLFPIRGKSCSTHAMPFLANKFTTYKQFAAASLEEIYTPKCLNDSYQVSANWLATSLLVNDGTGQFNVRPLPADAQIAPGFGTLVSDFTGNGHLDIFIAQNFHSPQPETGNMDGGLGSLLEGDGAGGFLAVAAAQSGIVVPFDATAACLADGGMLVGINNGVTQQVLREPSDLDFLKLRFEDITSSTAVAGVRVSVTRDGRSQKHEISAGSGYLSQQPPVLYLGSSKSDSTWEITVSWLDGTTTTHTAGRGDTEFIVPSP